MRKKPGGRNPYTELSAPWPGSIRRSGPGQANRIDDVRQIGQPMKLVGGVMDRVVTGGRVLDELDTGEGITNVSDNVDLSKETIDLALKTDAKHFSVGSLPTRINISGTFKDPKIRPGAEVGARAGAVAGLAALFLPRPSEQLALYSLIASLMRHQHGQSHVP
jgi:hypothetical protein